MKSVKKVFLLFVFFAAIPSAFSIDLIKPYPSFKHWIPYGNKNFARCLQCNAFVINASGTAYAALLTSDTTASTLSVMTLKNETWVPVGTPFSINSAIDISLAINPSDPKATPYIAYAPANSLSMVVDHLSGDKWQPVGASSLTAAGDGETLNVNNQGTPYLLYNIYNQLGDTTLRALTFNGSAWTQVGSDIPLDSSTTITAAKGLKIAFDLTGTPYITYKHPNGQYEKTLHVMKLVGKTWTLEGGSSLPINHFSFAVSPKGTPYILYTGSSPHVEKLGKGSNQWENVGQFIPPQPYDYKYATNLSIAISSTGTPYVSFAGINKPASLMNTFVMKLNNEKTQWIPVGNTNIFQGNNVIMPSSLTLDSNNNPYLFYSNNTYEATVETLSH